MVEVIYSDSSYEERKKRLDNFEQVFSDIRAKYTGYGFKITNKDELLNLRKVGDTK